MVVSSKHHLAWVLWTFLALALVVGCKPEGERRLASEDRRAGVACQHAATNRDLADISTAHASGNQWTDHHAFSYTVAARLHTFAYADAFSDA